MLKIENFSLEKRVKLFVSVEYCSVRVVQQCVKSSTVRGLIDARAFR